MLCQNRQGFRALQPLAALMAVRNFSFVGFMVQVISGLGDATRTVLQSILLTGQNPDPAEPCRAYQCCKDIRCKLMQCYEGNMQTHMNQDCNSNCHRVIDTTVQYSLQTIRKLINIDRRERTLPIHILVWVASVGLSVWPFKIYNPNMAEYGWYVLLKVSTFFKQKRSFQVK